jgi:hypothetical protein
MTGQNERMLRIMTDKNPINNWCRKYLEDTNNELRHVSFIEDDVDLEDDVDPQAYQEDNNG